MAVLIISHVKGQTPEGYDQVLKAVGESLKSAPGFRFHFAHESNGEWMVYEIWDKKELADSWFGKNIVPNLPGGVHPKRRYQELHSAVTPG